MEGSVEEVGLAGVEGEEEGLFSHGSVLPHHSRVVAGQQCLFGLNDDDDVAVAVDEVVEVDLLVATVLIQQLGLLDLTHHQGFNRIHQVLLLPLASLQHVSYEQGAVFHETGCSHTGSFSLHRNLS